MKKYSEIKIWKYMDLAKFIYMLITESLYFACPSKFIDPYEGYFPRSHIEAEKKEINEKIDHIKKDVYEMMRKQTGNKFTLIDTTNLLKPFITGVVSSFDELGEVGLKFYKKSIKRFGVSCWHKSEYESEAMWALYSASGQGIAIESTIEQLKLSLGNIEGLIIDSVRYRDFENSPIEDGDKNNILFMKRNSFEHEKELRARIPLPKEKEGEGTNILCNLDTLITRIYVSPYASDYFRDVVNSLCHSKIVNFEKPVILSKLFSEPNYEINIQDLKIET